RIDVTVLRCTPEVLAATKLSCDTEPPVRFGTVSDAECSRLLKTVRSDPQTKVLSEPKVVAHNGTPATFTIGGQVPVKVASGAHEITELRNVGLEMTMTPTVQPEQKVDLDLSLRFSAIVSPVGTNPGYDEQSLRTQIVLNPGQTMVIANCGLPSLDGKKKR